MTKYYFAITTALAVVSTAGGAYAVPFTEGNIVVYRTNVVTPSTAPSAVFVDEFALNNGPPVQTIALPSADMGANQALTAQSDATLEGLIHRSTDGQYLVLTGYDHNVNDATIPGGSTTLAQSSAADVPRTIGRIDFMGNVNTTTTYNDSGQGSPRSVVSDNGINFWIGQGSTGTGFDGGIRYTTLGSTGASVEISESTTNPRSVHIFNGQLYGSTSGVAATGTTTDSAVFSVSTGLPTTTGQTNTGLPGIAGTTGQNVVDFFLADLSESIAGLDTLYVAADANSALRKYSLVGDTWTSNGIIGVNADNYRGLTGFVNGTTVTLYATRQSGTHTVVSVQDTTGYNSADGLFAAIAPTVVATAGANQLFKGVALTPIAATVGQPGDHNGDGLVDAADYVAWRKLDGANPQGYNEFFENFGEGGGGGGGQQTAAGVPEPTVMGLLASAVMILVGFARGRRIEFARALARRIA